MTTLKKIKSRWLFAFFVVIPTFLTAIYNFLIATPIYISESKLIVKSIGDSGIGGISALLKTFGGGDSTSSSASVIIAFTQSRDMMNLLDRQFQVKDYFSKRGDLLTKFNPLGIDNSDESFQKYFTSKVVNSWVDTTSNIITIQTRAFDGDTAYQLNRELLNQAENFVNLLNKRASISAMSYYEEQIKKTKNKIENTSKRMSQFFKDTGIVSPEAQLMSQVQLLSELQRKLTERKLEQSKIQSLAPENPVLNPLREEIKRIETEINRGFDFLTSKLGRHSVELELFKTELQTLQAELNAHIQAFIQSQNQAFMKHLFIEAIQNPTKPDKATEPKEFKNIFTVFVSGFLLWGIVSLLIAGVKEHTGV